MTENEEETFTVDDLQECTYRYLQGIAKNLKLPCNVKKIHLVNMIYAKKYRSSSELEAIMKQVREERHIATLSKLNQLTIKKKKNLQAQEVSSTSPHSPKQPQAPAGDMIHCSPELMQSVVKCDNEPRRSGRLLRSVTNRQNYKYMLKNTLIGVVKSQNTSKKIHTQRLAVDKKSPPRMKYYINQIKTSILNPSNVLGYVKKNLNELKIETYSRNRVRTQKLETVPTPVKRQRTLSGIYPLSPPDNEPKTFINIRGKDGKMTKINAYIQKKENNVQNHSYTVQDIINTNIKNKYMIANTGSATNEDYPNMFSVIDDKTPRTQIKTYQNLASLHKEKDIMNLPQETRSLLVQKYCPTKNMTIVKHIPLNSTPKEKPICYLQEEQNNTVLGNQDIEQPNQVNYCPTNQNNITKLDQNYTRQEIPIYTNLATSINREDISSNRQVIPINRSTNIPIYRPEIIPERTEIISTNIAEIDRPHYPIYNRQANSAYTRSEMYPRYGDFIPNYSQDTAPYHSGISYSQIRPENPNYDQNQANHISQSVYNTNQWVYNQNHFNQNYSMDSSGDFSTYYHKKIRAEQIRSRRCTNQREIEDNPAMLPRINQAFSRFNNVERDLTQPLYVQVSKESERIFNYPIFAAKNQPTHLLECIYNFKNSFLTGEPVLKVVSTTSATNCTYSTPIITTPMAQSSSVVSMDPYIASSMGDEQPSYTNNNYTPRMYDLLRVAEQEEAAMRKELNTARSSSSTSSASSAAGDVTIPEMVDDAMEIISQDGDYMERINSDLSDLNVQCYVCSWTGSRVLYQYHLKKEHGHRDDNEFGPILPIYYSPRWSPRVEQ